MHTTHASVTNPNPVNQTFVAFWNANHNGNHITTLMPPSSFLLYQTRFYRCGLYQTYEAFDTAPPLSLNLNLLPRCLSPISLLSHLVHIFLFLPVRRPPLTRSTFPF